MRKVLIITDTFVPDKRGRSEKIATRMSLFLKNGWEPVLFVPRRLFTPRYYDLRIRDETFRIYRHAKYNGIRQSQLQKENERGGSFYDNLKTLISPGIKQYIRIFFPFIYFPDAYSRWIISGIIIGKRIVEKERISVIYSMNNPVSLHLIAYGIKMLKGIPWLAEFRDPWVGNPRIFRNGKPDIVSKFLERAVVKYCDKVILYDGIQVDVDYFYRTYPNVGTEKIMKLSYLGYLPEYFEQINSDIFDSFTITYTGSFHDRGAGPDNFLRALSGFIHKNNLEKGKIRVNFLSSWNKEYSKMIRDLNLIDYIFVYGWVCHEKAVSILKGSDVCLYINRGLKGDELSISQKIWDYIGAEKPILALANRNCKINQFIQMNNLGIIADKDDINEIQVALEKLYKSWRDEINLFNPSPKFLSSLDRKKLIKDFCLCMDKLVEEK